MTEIRLGDLIQKLQSPRGSQSLTSCHRGTRVSLPLKQRFSISIWFNEVQRDYVPSQRDIPMSAYPLTDVSGGWGYPHGVPSISSGPGLSNGITGNGGLSMPFNGFSYVGATPLNQPRRHFPHATPVLGNYAANSVENELSLDPYISKFSPTTQWQMTGKTHDSYASPEDDNQKQFYDQSLNNRQLVDLPDPQMQVQLCDKELWGQFSKAGTEMIVTKTGRRMFPGYRIKISGLEKDAKYCVMMDIVNVDDHRYKFQHGEWTIAGRGEPHLPQRFFLHPDSPATGTKWMNEIVSFHKVKLTNSVGRDVDGKIVLNSMHRYQPRIHIVRTNDASTVHLQRLCTFAFPQTVFITVTAYQNPEVTKLKIDHNPFAKGFREDGARAKKPRPSPNNYPDYDAISYPDTKRQTFERGYSSTPMQRTPVVGAPFSRLGFDHGASPELSHLRPHQYAYSQIQPHQPSDFSTNVGAAYPYNMNNTNSQNNWNSPASQHTQANQVPQLSYPQYTPASDSLPYYHPLPQSETQYANLDTSTEIVTRQPQNLDDIMEKVEQEVTTLESYHIPITEPTAISSTDSGFGSSPSALSEDDNAVASTEAVETYEQILADAERISQSSPSQNLTEVQTVNATYEDSYTSHDSPLETVGTPQLSETAPQNLPSATTVESSNNSSTIEEDNFSTSISVAEKNTENLYESPETIFSIGPEAFHRTFASEANCPEDAINWETGLVKM